MKLKILRNNQIFMLFDKREHTCINFAPVCLSVCRSVGLSTKRCPLLCLKVTKRPFLRVYLLAPIPWSVNSFLQYKSLTSGNNNLKWYIYWILLRVKCHEHWCKIDVFLDPITPIFFWQRHLFFRREWWRTEWMCLHTKESIQVTW